MSYAVRNDGEPGWRSVGSADELFPHEIYSEVEPPKAVLAPPSADELATVARVQRDQLLIIAANRMGPLQDAVDIDRATADEAARLVLWKGYRIDLNRIEEQEAFPADIDWPLSPDAAPAE